MIPANYKDEIVQNGINFMRSITKAYGSDVGLELYEKIVSVIDPSVKGEILFSLLCGEGSEYICIDGIMPAFTDRVARIRMVRNVSTEYMGLKDAKDFDDAIMRGSRLKVRVSYKSRHVALESLESVGYVCS